MSKASTKPSRKPVQASVTERLDTVIAKMIEEGFKPAAIYLTPTDWKQYRKIRTKEYREETGSTAEVHPLSYGDVLLISEKIIDKVEIPVRQRIQGRKLQSTVYASTGSPFPLWLGDVL